VLRKEVYQAKLNLFVMVKAPPVNGYGGGGGKSASHSKFKSWRRGKSTKAKNAGKPSSSLKQQLRGLQRLQKKKLAEATEETIDDAQRKQELQQRMDALQQQVENRHASEKERLNSINSHKMRFIERQRTTRLYKQLMSQLKVERQEERRDAIDHELWKVALDQIYIAHFPLDQTSYLSIFQNGSSKRRLHTNNRLLYKMATCRRRVLERLAATTTACASLDHNDIAKPETNNVETTDSSSNVRKNRIQRVDWIDSSQYERIRHVTTWSTDQERETFGTAVVTTSAVTAAAASAKCVTDSHEALDARFQGLQPTATQNLLLQQQDEVERALEAELAEAVTTASGKRANNDTNGDNNDDLTSGDSDSSDSDDDSDSSTDSTASSTKQSAQQTKQPATTTEQGNDVESSDNETDEDSLAADENDKDETLTTTQALRNLATSKKTSQVVQNNAVTEEDDDFLVEATDAAVADADVFTNAKHHVPARNEAAGDKSQGWATQRQYPGQFRKKPKRR
jgi:rRNA-processing protein Efg1